MYSFIKKLQQQQEKATDEGYPEVAEALKCRIEATLLLLNETKNSVDTIVEIRDNYNNDAAVRLNAAKSILSVCAMTGADEDNPMNGSHTVQIYLPETKALNP